MTWWQALPRLMQSARGQQDAVIVLSDNEDEQVSAGSSLPMHTMILFVGQLGCPNNSRHHTASVSPGFSCACFVRLH